MPLPVMVTVAVLALVPVFAAAVAVTVALLAPLAGETVNQLWLLLAVQLTFEVTLMFWLPADEE
jgi:hypothetical protein